MTIREEIKASSLKVRRIIVTFLSILTAMVVIFLAQLTLNIQSELKTMRMQLTDLQERTAKQPLPGMIAAPFAALEDTCLGCHNRQKLMGMRKTPFEIRRVLNSMRNHAALDPSDEKQDQIYASLLLLRCAGCHSENRIADFSHYPADSFPRGDPKENVHAEAGIFRQDIEETLKVYSAVTNGHTSDKRTRRPSIPYPVAMKGGDHVGRK